jgi:hypothetical protein
VLRNEYPLRCVARDGTTSVWLYDILVDGAAGVREWWVRVWPQDGPGPDDGGEVYEVRLEEVDAESVRVTLAANHLPTPYHGRGVAPALYPVLARRLGRRLLSSRPEVPGTEEWRAARATDIWRWLVDVGEADELPAEDAFVIDGRSGKARPTRAGPLPERPAPTSEAEFVALMETIDARLQAEGVAITNRELLGVGRICELLALELRITYPARAPRDGVYEGDDLAMRASHWFRARYGDRLLVDASPGRVAVLLRGDVWVFRLPRIRGGGRVRFFASRTEASTLPDKPEVVRAGDPRRERRPPAGYNVLDALAGLSDGLRRDLTDDELRALHFAFMTGIGAYEAMWDVRDARFVPEALADHEQAVAHLAAGARAHGGQARWAALQATEKMYKAYLQAMGAPIPLVHDIAKLSVAARKTGLPEADPHFVAAVQCSPGVRYGGLPVRIDEAVAAHHAALDLSWYLAEALKERRGTHSAGSTGR